MEKQILLGEGMYLFGRCYENGLGIEKSEAQAKKLYKKAAKKGTRMPRPEWNR